MVAASFVIIALARLVDVQLSLVLLGLLALSGAGARVVTRADRAFAVRRRAVDVAALGVLGAALLFLAFTTPLR